ncbi:MAG TPA: hypothetical protein VGH82_10365 [Gaiellaceae bacterium]|jgi:hypothetical protein
MRDRIRFLLLFTPWVSVPLALLGVFLAVLFPLMQWTHAGWIIYGVGVAGAIAGGFSLRRRYRLSILDSSSLGVMSWLQRRSGRHSRAG